MSLMLQMVKKALPPQAKAVVSAVGAAGWVAGKLEAGLAAGSAIPGTDRVRAILDNLVTVQGPHEYQKDYFYLERTDWTRALLALENVSSGTLYLIETTSEALPGCQIIVFSKYDVSLRGCMLIAKLQKRDGGVQRDEMSRFIESIVQLASETDARYREVTHAGQRVRVE